MKERGYLTSIGIVIYVILSAVDKFIYSIPNYIYIAIAIIGIIFILVGFIKNKKQNNK